MKASDKKTLALIYEKNVLGSADHNEKAARIERQVALGIELMKEAMPILRELSDR